MWKKSDPQCEESSKIRWELVPYTRGLGLDIGCGPVKAFPHFIGVDNRSDQVRFKIWMDPDLTVPDAADMPMFATESMDFVFSSHLLEHIKDHIKALKEWWRLVKVGGHLCLYLPHKNFYPNMGKDGANPDHKHDFLPKDIIAVMRDLGAWDLVENQERNQANEYSFFQVYRKTAEKQKQSWTKPKPKLRAAIVRYGAIGDLIQTASVAAALKAQGYHVTLYCEGRGHEVVKHDPSFDAFVIQDKDQVPNLELGGWWHYLEQKYEKFVNLSESVEGGLLALPDRMPVTWPINLRRKLYNRNYLEFMHDIAGTQYQWFKEAQVFHPTKEEDEWAIAERKKIPGIAIAWSVAGSSIHKVWPHIDAVWARLLSATDATVITLGDASASRLEKGWENEARIWKRCGEWTVRQSLSFIRHVNVMVGPETGTLNSVAFLKHIAKIVMMSHSSVENLSRDWVNTCSLIPMHTACYPCHKMIYSWDQCSPEPEGVSTCAKDISIEQMWLALCQVISEEHFTMPDKRIVLEAAK